MVDRSIANDWEDEYQRLKIMFEELKIANNKKDLEIKKIQIKSRKLENNLLPSERVLVSRLLDDHEVDHTWKDQITKLKISNSNLRAKVKQLEELLEKRNREIQLLKRFLSDSKRNNQSRNDIIKALQEVKLKPASGNKRRDVESIVNHIDNSDENILEIARKYKTRYMEAEEEVAQLREELSRVANGGVLNFHDPPPPPSPSKTVKIHSVPEVDEHDAHAKDNAWRLQQLQTQHDYLQTKSTAQAHAHQRTEEQVEDLTQKVRDLRRSLEELRAEKEISDTKAMRVSELDNTVVELQQTNKSLESKILQLCETPFITDAFAHQELQLKFQESQQSIEDYKLKVSHLQEAVKSHFAALTTLKQQATQWREDKEEAERNLEEIRLKYQDLEMGNNILEDRLRLYCGEDGVDMESLERALTIVRRRGEALKKLPFLEDVEGESLITVPDLKKKLGEVQLINLQQCEQIERFESMLRLQSSINKDLHTELENLVHKADADKKDLLQRASDMEDLSLRRLEKIQSLEAQLRQLVYGIAKPREMGNTNKENIAESSLLSELLSYSDGNIAQGVDLKPDENLIEIWIKNAVIQPGIVPTGSATFAVIDFFDYESQTTSLVNGSKPSWDFGATYKLVVDDFLLRYLATDSATIELNMTTQGDFTMLARCTIPLSGLLKSKPTIQLRNYPMISVSDGTVIAQINIDIRLGLPVSELYRLFLQRHPTEKSHIEELAARQLLNTVPLSDDKNISQLRSVTDMEDNSRLYNELEISVLQAANLPDNPDKSHPTSYAVFQFLGNPDSFTNPVPNDNNPIYDEVFNFPLVTEDKILRLMQRNRLVIMVIDLNGETRKYPHQGLIGEAYISLNELTDGVNIVEESYALKNKEGQPAGEIKVSVRWKNTFRQKRELGPQTISAVDVEQIISAFQALDADGNTIGGVVDYKAFCRFADPPEDVRRGMDGIIKYCRAMQSQHSASVYDVLAAILGEEQKVSENLFLDQFLSVKGVDITPLELNKLFKFVDTNTDGIIALNQLVALLNMDELVGIKTAVQEKLRNRVRELKSRHVFLQDFIQEVDRSDSPGHMTRSEFKRILQKIGLHLIDEPTAISHSAPIHDQSHSRTAGGTATHPSINTVVQHSHELLPDNVDTDDCLDTLNNPIRLSSMPSRRSGFSIAAAKQKMKFEEKKYNMMNQSHAANEPKQPSAYDHHSTVVSHDTTEPFFRSTGIPRGNEEESLSNDPIYPSLQSEMEMTIEEPHMSHASIVSSAPIVGSILQAEDTIRASAQGISYPNLLHGFQTVDTENTGYVNRAQFAHVLTQFDELKLYGGELRACMDYFDNSTNGTEIDYQAFCRFSRYKAPQLPIPIVALKSMSYNFYSIAKLRAIDLMNSGFLKRSDMLAIFSDLGLDQHSPAVLVNALKLFEVRNDGLVDYTNLIEYANQNGIGADICELSNQLYLMVTSGKDQLPNDKTIRDWFKRIDTKLRGVFHFEDLQSFFVSMGIHVSQNVAYGVFASMDVESLGVRLNNFATWLKSFHHREKSLLSLYHSLKFNEIQRKCHAYLSYVSECSETTLEELSASFMVYDWKTPASGNITKLQFQRAVTRAGFPLTLNEIHSLETEFTCLDASGRVSYLRFLKWSTPDISTNHPSRESSKNIEVRSVGSIMKFLQSKYRKGVDLLSIFGRYDTLAVGRISVDDFCAAVSDIGLSTITRSEVIELSDRYKCIVGDYVMYRRFISELLQDLDEADKSQEIDCIDLLKSLLQRWRLDVRTLRHSFEKFDPKDTGKVRDEHVLTAFQDANIKIKLSELDSLFEKYALDTDERFPYRRMLRDLNDCIGDRNFRQKTNPHLPTELALKLREFFEDLILQGKDFRSEMDSLDENFSGSLLQPDFREVVEYKLKGTFTDDEFAMLGNIYRDHKDPRKVNHLKLIHSTHPRFMNQQSQDESTSSASFMWFTSELLRLKIRRRCNYLAPGELKRPFRHFLRTAGKQGVSLTDFTMAVKDLGIKLNQEQYSELFKYFLLIPQQELIHYNDFVVFVRDAFNQDVVWKFKRSQARNRIPDCDIEDCVRKMDMEFSGLITTNQFVKVLDLCHIELSSRDIKRLVAKFDDDESERLNVEKFLHFIKGFPNASGSDVNINDNNLRPIAKGVTESTTYAILREKVDEKLKREGYTGYEIFSYFDPHRHGVIDIHTLIIGARELGINISQTESRAVLRRMSSVVGGSVDRDNFLASLQLSLEPETDSAITFKRKRIQSREYSSFDPYEASLPSKISSGDDSSTDKKKTAEELLQSIRYEVLKACSKFNSRGKGSKISEREYFEDSLDQFGVMRNGFIAQKELLVFLQDMGIDVVTAYDVHQIARLLQGNRRDEDHDLLNINTFTDALFPRDHKNQGVEDEGRIYDLLQRRRDLLEEMKDNLRRIHKAHKRTVNDLLIEMKRMDTSNSGTLPGKDFLKVIGAFGFTWHHPSTAKELLSVIQMGDIQSSVKYEDFVSAINKSVSAEENTAEALESLKCRIVVAINKGNSSRSITKCFEDSDKNKSSEVSINEVEDILDQKFGVRLSREDMHTISTKFSNLKSNKIRYYDFIRYLNIEKHTQIITVHDVVKLMCAQLDHVYGSRLNALKEAKRLFTDADVDRNNAVTTTEFQRILKDLQITLTADQRSALILHFDSQNGVVDSMKTINYSHFLTALQDGRVENTSEERGKLLRLSQVAAKSIGRIEITNSPRIAIKLRTKLLDAWGSESATARKVADVYKSIDKKEIDDLTNKQVSELLCALRIDRDVSESDVDQLMTWCETNGDHRVSLKGILRLFML